MSFVSLMSQGDYIYLIVDTILNSLLLGAVFAILILFLCFQKTTPVRAKAIGKWALIGFIVGVALSILSGVLGALAS